MPSLNSSMMAFFVDGLTVGFSIRVSPVLIRIAWHIEAIDTDGNVSKMFFTLTESSPHHIATLEGHTSSVNSVAFSPVDATLLATGSSDGTVKLWDVMTQQNIATFKGHTAGVTSVSFSSDGTVLASGSWDRTVKLWNMVTQQNIATFKGHTTGIDSVSFSSDKRRLRYWVVG